MKCLTHNIEMSVVCDEDVCAQCYAEETADFKGFREIKGPDYFESPAKNVKSPVVLIAGNIVRGFTFWAFPSLNDALEWAKVYAGDLEWVTTHLMTPNGVSITNDLSSSLRKAL